MTQKIAIGSDHAGCEYKKLILAKWAGHAPYEFFDAGGYDGQAIDYPDVGHVVAQHIAKGIYDKGILICSTGNGMNMVANKYAKVRSALCWSVEIIRLCREHNDANVLCMPARFLTAEESLSMVDVFLHTDFLTEERHDRRIKKISMLPFKTSSF